MTFRSTITTLTIIASLSPSVHASSPGKLNALCNVAHVITTTVAFGFAGLLGVTSFGAGLQYMAMTHSENVGISFIAACASLLPSAYVLYKTPQWTEDCLHKKGFRPKSVGHIEFSTTGNILNFGGRLALAAGLYYGFGYGKALYQSFLIHR